MLALLEAPPDGVFPTLNETCVLPKANDASFLAALSKRQKEHARLGKPHARKARSCFIVRHSAADVQYAVEGFVEKVEWSEPV